MKILVTGGAGFIGTNLCMRLLEEGNEVICLDSLVSGQLQNVRRMSGYENFQFVEHDVIHPYHFDGLDQIYNLACAASPVHYQADPIHTAKTGFLGALHALEEAKTTGATVLQTSTSEVYGEPLMHPQTETYRGNVNPIGIRACYDESKRVAETLFFDHQRMYGTRIRVVRIFNTYGPFMDAGDGRVISNLILQALQGRAMTIYGDGTQTRCFCYVSDLVDALIRMMNQEGFTGPVNLGNPVEITVRELAEMIKDMTDSGSRIEYRELPKDDPTRRRPDIRLAGEKLDWQPRVTLHDGLVKTIDYYSRLLQEEIQK